MKAVRHGHDIKEFITFLRENSKTTIPQPVEFMLNEIDQLTGKVKINPSYAVIRFDSDQTAKSALALIKDKSSITIITPSVISVNNPEAYTKMIKLLEKEGYIIPDMVYNRELEDDYDPDNDDEPISQGPWN